MPQSYSRQVNRFRLKEIDLKLERCDKIWKTLQLIRSTQNRRNQCFDVPIKQEPTSSVDSHQKEPPMIFIPDASLPLHLMMNHVHPYQTYEPAVGSSTTDAKPQFQLAVKSRVSLYHCELCSKEYCDQRSFTSHRERIHGITSKRPLGRKTVRGKSLDLESIDNNTPLENSASSSLDKKVPARKPSLTVDKAITPEKILRGTKLNPTVPSVPVKPVAVDTTLPELPYVPCSLCTGTYKYLTKHMIRYHKVNPQALSQAALKVSETTQPNPVVENNSNSTIQNSLKRKHSASEIVPSKKARTDLPRTRNSSTHIPNKTAIICDICGTKFGRNQALRRHLKKSIPCKPIEKVSATSEPDNSNTQCGRSLRSTTRNENGNDNIDSTSSDDNAKSIQETQASSYISTRARRKTGDLLPISSTVDNRSDLPSSVQKDIENKCACGRSFRNAYILFTHKSKCTVVEQPKVPEPETCSTLESKDSSISITIKKNNNSYEIVSKDSTDEKTLPDNAPPRSSAPPEDTSISPIDCDDEDSDASETETVIPEASKYSENHRVMKMQVAEEDGDVDIESDSDSYSDSVDATDHCHGGETIAESSANTSRSIVINPFSSQGRNDLLLKTIKRDECEENANQGPVDEGTNDPPVENDSTSTPSPQILGDILFCDPNMIDKGSGDDTPSQTRPDSDEFQHDEQPTVVDAIAVDLDPQLPQSRPEIPRLTSLCKSVFASQGIWSREETTHECLRCNIFLGSIEKFEKHNSKHRGMRRLCDCGELFPTIEKLDAHVREVHPRYVVCAYCEENFKNIVALSEHVCPVPVGKPYTEILSENYPCPNCNIVFSDVTWLESHLRSKHRDDDLPFSCYKCVEKFPTEADRYAHVNKSHGDLIFCFICHKKFQTVKSRQMHDAYHRGVGFPCHECKRTYPRKNELTKHTETVHDKKSDEMLDCFICNKSVKMKTLRRHVYAHKCFIECEICHVTFDNLRGLKVHIGECHENDNYPYHQCNECKASFMTEEQLGIHNMLESWKQKSDHGKSHKPPNTTVLHEG